MLLAVSAVTTTLTLKDALGAHATLASIGASRRTLRRMAATRSMNFAVLWGWIAALVLGVPALAALATLVLVRPAAPRAVRLD